MAVKNEKQTLTEKNIKLLSVVTLLRKVRDGISNEELYNRAERNFDILIDLLNDVYTKDDIIDSIEFSLEDFRQGSLLIFNRLISVKNPDPFMTLCVSREAPFEEIRRRRNKLLQIFHPDRNWDNFASEIKSRKINEVYEQLQRTFVRTHILSNDNYSGRPGYYPYKKNHLKSKFVLFVITLILILAFAGLIKILLFP